jgi:hypothetical protein
VPEVDLVWRFAPELITPRVCRRPQLKIQAATLDIFGSFHFQL